MTIPRTKCLNVRVGPKLHVAHGSSLKHVSFLNQHSSVGIVTMTWILRPRNRGSIACSGKTFVSSPKRPDRLCDPHNLVSICTGGWGRFPRGQNSRGVKLTVHPIECAEGLIKPFTCQFIKVFTNPKNMTTQRREENGH
jgi:hypothetical protein